MCIFEGKLTFYIVAPETWLWNKTIGVKMANFQVQVDRITDLASFNT